MLGPLTPVIVLPPLVDDKPAPVPATTAVDTVDLTSLIPADLDAALATITVNVAPPTDTATPVPFREHVNFNRDSTVSSWDAYQGQVAMKRYVRTFINDAQSRYSALPHMILATGMPGAGKTTFARACADEMDARMVELVPPFTVETLYEVAENMGDGGVLFIDEIHKLADNGPRDAEALLTMLEENTLYIGDRVVHLAEFTVIGATTDAGKLPPAVLSRFPIRPYFVDYTLDDLSNIALGFAGKLDVDLPPDTITAIAKACQGIPRSVRDLVFAARALLNGEGSCTPDELLAFTSITTDGLTRVQVEYLTRMFKHYGRVQPDGTMIYSAGENTMASALREPAKAIPAIERYLVDCGFLNKTPRGRFLTESGAARAAQLVATGE